MDIDKHLATRVRDLRKAQGLTLEALAERSGVSRSAISLIEREETSPTAAVLDKLANALRVSLSALFATEDPEEFASPLARAADHRVWTDPESGYMRRHLSPATIGSPLELVEVTFPAGKSVTFDTAGRSNVVHQQVWMLEGEMEITIGKKAWRLRPGDCLAMVPDQPLAFRNPTRKVARYAVAMATATSLPRRF
ncbi:XRE family transcriptional regulator [Mitsuaria sp. GD03876]|uniref:helix-turn-helix domain-containing protein n=1 Tax=Mitsuaria sp. GD03876 TaxID=2975399 RepID=UPI00244C3912|nr:XRE family transcriptional regulator [Mitsuaria sp. GD03876]MDH0865859.1 XRE family transcriptional regulator [Mitsuaria sp. GD03876]